MSSFGDTRTQHESRIYHTSAKELLKMMNIKANEGRTVIHFTQQFPPDPLRTEWNGEASCKDFEWHDGRGNLSFVCNNRDMAAHVSDWINSDCDTEPMSIRDVGTADFYSLLLDIKSWKSEEMAYAAFPAEMMDEEEQEAQQEEKEYLDGIEGEEDAGYTEEEYHKTKVLMEEKEMLEEIPLPGSTVNEKERQKNWLKLPRKGRAAVRRMHATFGHCPKGPFLEILKASRAPSEYIEAAKHMRCNSCEYTDALPKRSNKVSLPRPYIFNHTVGIDINFTHTR